MAYTQAEIQAQARGMSGKALQFNEDLHAAFDVLAVTQGRQLNERVIAYTGQANIQAAWLFLSTYGFLFRPTDVGIFPNVTPAFGKTYQDPQATTLSDDIGESIGLIKPLNTASNVGILDGSAGCYFSTPLTSILGNIRIEVYIAPNSWDAVQKKVASKSGDLVGDLGWIAYYGSSGDLQLLWSPNGLVASAIFTGISTEPVSFDAGSAHWIAYDLVVDNGAGGWTLVFETSTDGESWDQLGDPVTGAGVTSIFDSSAPLQISGFNGASGDSYVAGAVKGTRVYSSAGTKVFDLTPENYVSGSTYTCGTGQTVTLNGTAVIVPEVSLYTTTAANRPLLAGLPRGGVRNLLAYDGISTLDLSTADWQRNGAVSITGTDQFTYAGGAGSPEARFVQATPTIPHGTAAQTFTVSMTVQSVSGTSGFRLICSHGGVANQYSSDKTATTTPQRFEYTVTNGGGAGTGVQFVGLTANTGDAAYNVIITDPQIERAASASAYQSVTAAYDIAQSGIPTLYFPLFDGSNDQLITGLTKFGTSKLFADATAEPDGFSVFLPFIVGATGNGVLLDNTNLRVTYTVATGVISILCRGTSTDLTATTFAWGEVGLLYINYDGGTALTAMLNSLTPQTVTIGANADAGTVITVGSTSAGATPFKGWLLGGMLDRANPLVVIQAFLQVQATALGITLV